MTLDDIMKGNIFTGDLELIHFLDITDETENNTDKEQYFLKVLETVHNKSKDFKVWEFLDTFNDQRLGCVIWDDTQEDTNSDNFEFHIENYTLYYDKKMNPLICSDLAIILGLAFLYQYLNVSKVGIDVFNKPEQFADFINGLKLEEDEEELLMGLLLGTIFGTHYYDFYLDNRILHPSYEKILNIYNILDGIDYRLSDYEIKDHFKTNESLRKNFCILRSDIIRYIKKALKIQEVK
jgi:hypothetical protein